MEPLYYKCPVRQPWISILRALPAYLASLSPSVSSEGPGRQQRGESGVRDTQTWPAWLCWGCGDQKGSSGQQLKNGVIPQQINPVGADGRNYLCPSTSRQMFYHRIHGGKWQRKELRPGQTSSCHRAPRHSSSGLAVTQQAPDTELKEISLTSKELCKGSA